MPYASKSNLLYNVEVTQLREDHFPNKGLKPLV
jgi:hypothetical protein